MPLVPTWFTYEVGRLSRSGAKNPSLSFELRGQQERSEGRDGQREREKTRSRRCSTHRSTHPTASQRFPPPHEHPTHPPSEGGAAAAAPTPQHARICHSAIVSIPVASRQDTAVAGVRTPSIHENPHSLLIVSAGKTPPTCDEIVDLRHSACGHNKLPQFQCGHYGISGRLLCISQ